MTWHIEFIAENKAAARDLLSKTTADIPAGLKDFINHCIDEFADDGLIQVRSNGHTVVANQAESNASVLVKRLHIQSVQL